MVLFCVIWTLLGLLRAVALTSEYLKMSKQGPADKKKKKHITLLIFPETYNN